MGSVKKVMLSNGDAKMDLCAAIKDMGELRLVRKNIEGNEILYLRERTAFEAFKDFFGFNKSERRQQEREISGLINSYLERHSIGGKHGETLRQAMQNIRTVVEQRHCLSGREIAKEMENYKNQNNVMPLAGAGFVAFPMNSAISLLPVAAERVAGDLAVLRVDTALRLPAIHDQAKAAQEYFQILHKRLLEQGTFSRLQSGASRDLAASTVTMIPDLKSSDSSVNTDLVKLLFGQVLKGKSGKIVVEPIFDSPQGCTDANLRAMLEAIDESIAASGKENGKLKLKVAIAVADDALCDRIRKIGGEIFSSG